MRTRQRADIRLCGAVVQQRGNGVAAVSDDAVQGHYETFNRTEPPRKRGRATPGLEAVKTPGRPKQEGNAASNGDIPALTLAHRLNPFYYDTAAD